MMLRCKPGDIAIIELTPNIQLSDHILHADKWLKPIRPSERVKSKELKVVY